MESTALYGKQLRLQETSGSKKGPNLHLQKIRQYQNSVSQQFHHKGQNRQDSHSSSMQKQLPKYHRESGSSECYTDQFERKTFSTDIDKSCLDSRKCVMEKEDDASRLLSDIFKGGIERDASQFTSRDYEVKTSKHKSQFGSGRYEERRVIDKINFHSEMDELPIKTMDRGFYSEDEEVYLDETRDRHFECEMYETKSDANRFDYKQYEESKECHSSRYVHIDYPFDIERHKSRKESAGSYESRREKDRYVSRNESRAIYASRKESDDRYESNEDCDASRFNYNLQQDSYVYPIDSERHQVIKNRDTSHPYSKRYELTTDSDRSNFNSERYNIQEENYGSPFDSERYQVRKVRDTKPFNSPKYGARKGYGSRFDSKYLPKKWWK